MKKSHYVAKQADINGVIDYSEQENQTWKTLINRQLKVIENKACQEFLKGLDILQFPTDRIPQLQEVNSRLEKATGWSVTQVPALIDFDTFFSMLAKKQFPAATFIRTPEELDYLQEPDIFHELFGHCPMLCDPACADFMQKYGELGKYASRAERVMLARLYWFTIEFGLINTDKGLRSFGAGILSSISETVYALESYEPERKPFVALETLRTPYRIDMLQKTYFVLDSYKDLFSLANVDLYRLIKQARLQGLLASKFPPKEQSDTVEAQIRWQVTEERVQV